MPVDYAKPVAGLKQWLLGKGYFVAVKALELAKEHHTGLRKDGVTPYILHPVTVTNYLRTMDTSLLYPERTYAAGLLHDIIEDCNVSYNDLEKMFGYDIANAVYTLSKSAGYTSDVLNGIYYEGIAKNPVTSVVKGADRIHNVQTMIGVFNEPKQKSYIQEAESHTLPMIKTARNLHPEQYGIYENIKLVLNSQISLVKAIHNSHNEELDSSS